MADYDSVAKIPQILKTYNDNVTREINQEGERCAKGLRKDLRSGSPSHTGAYGKSWQSKVTATAANGSKEYTVHNTRHYQLTHLLERPHAGPYGRGMVPAHPHIGPLEKKWNEDFEESVERVIQDEGGSN